MSERRNSVVAGVSPDVVLGLFVVAAVVALDQLSKAASTAQVGANVRNTGLLLGVAPGPRLALIAVSAAVLVVFAAAILRSARQVGASIVGPTLVVGGMIGNLADRVRLGSVRDFLHAGPLIINVADVAVAIGIALTIASAAIRVAQLRINGKALAFDRRTLRIMILDGSA